MPLYTARSTMGARINIINPDTGEQYGYALWADTDWAMMKVLKVRTVNGRDMIVKVQGSDGKFEPATEYVVRDFDVVDRKTKQLLHCVRQSEIR